MRHFASDHVFRLIYLIYLLYFIQLPYFLPVPHSFSLFSGKSFVCHSYANQPGGGGCCVSHELFLDSELCDLCALCGEFPFRYCRLGSLFVSGQVFRLLYLIYLLHFLYLRRPATHPSPVTFFRVRIPSVTHASRQNPLREDLGLPYRLRRARPA